jgi:hypothetical protein
MYCVGCDMEVRTEAKAPKNATPAPPAVPSPKASAEGISPSPAAASGRSRTDSSFASSAIAQKLLVGWTLLGEVTGSSATPLSPSFLATFRIHAYEFTCTRVSVFSVSCLSFYPSIFLSIYLSICICVYVAVEA